MTNSLISADYKTIMDNITTRLVALKKMIECQVDMLLREPGSQDGDYNRLTYLRMLRAEMTALERLLEE